MNRQSEVHSAHSDLIEAAVRGANLGQSWRMVGTLGGGLSTSTLYRIAIGGRDYVARLTAPDDPHNDLSHEHAVMQTVNQLGIAPCLHYADATRGIAITDYVVSEPFFPWSDERPPLLSMLAELVRTLHRGPMFPYGQSIFAKAETILGWLPSAFQTAPLVVAAVELMKSIEPIVRDPAYLRPGHGDINPGNLLFDGLKLWLIDWASAGQENFYFDLACCTNFFFYRSKESEMAFLHAYFERQPTAEELATYEQMSIFCAIYYGLVFLYMSGLQGTPLLGADEIARLPDYPAFMDLVGTGKERLDDSFSQQRLGFVYLQRASVIGAC